MIKDYTLITLSVFFVYFHFIVQYVALPVLTVYSLKKVLNNKSYLHGLELGLALVPSYYLVIIITITSSMYMFNRTLK